MDHRAPAPGRDAETAVEKAPSHRVDRRLHAVGPRSGDSAHLGTLSKRKPATKSAQIRWLWPEIRAALAAGHSIGDVRRELALDGIQISYSKLRTYVAQLRRAHPQDTSPDCVPEPGVAASNGPSVEITSSAWVTRPATSSITPPVYDPLANLRERLTRRPGFQYDGRPPDEKELI
jgi:hypothetical protein